MINLEKLWEIIEVAQKETGVSEIIQNLKVETCVYDDCINLTSYYGCYYSLDDGDCPSNCQFYEEKI